MLPLVNVRKFYYQRIECDLAIFCATISDKEILCFDAKQRIQFIHACYSVAYNIKSLEINPLIHRYIAVSKTAGNDFYKLTGHMPEIMYNPICIEQPKRVLKLISATRITEDKGSIWDKMKIFARKLIDNDIPFIWLVFTNNTNIKSDIKDIVLMPSTLNITPYIAEADYLSQFSKTEADCLSIKESLKLGTPVLVTNFDAAVENGVKDGVNGYIFDMDLSNVDVDKIYNNIPKFEYQPNSSDKEWKKLLGPEQSNIPEDTKVKVKCIFEEGFTDMEYNCFRKKGDTWYTDEQRAHFLMNYKLADGKNFTIIKLIDIME